MSCLKLNNGKFADCAMRHGKHENVGKRSNGKRKIVRPHCDKKILEKEAEQARRLADKETSKRRKIDDAKTPEGRCTSWLQGL